MTDGLHPRHRFALVLLAGLGACATAASGEGSTVNVKPGDDLAAIVAAGDAGTTYRLQPGIYRLQTIEPKDGDAFVGQVGGQVILSGAKLLDFSRDGSYWVAGDQSRRGVPHGVVEKGHEGAQYPEDLFVDGKPLLRVMSRADLRPGAWYFDYDAGSIVLTDDPAGHVVETSVSGAAFRSTGSHVAIRDLIVEKYAVAAQFGAIGDDGKAQDWMIDGCEVRLNHGTGIKAGDGWLIRDSFIHHNGQLGIGGSGVGIRILGNEVAYNNTLKFSSGWEAGGVKFVRSRDLLVEGNYVHDNDGPGLWTDWLNTDVRYVANYVADNGWMGIFHEFSGKAAIERNIVKHNSADPQKWLYGAQILLSTSSDAIVRDNVVEVAAAGGNGITIIRQDRGPEYDASNNLVTGNSVTYLANEGVSGAAADYEVQKFLTSSHNRFDANHYHAPNIGFGRWVWVGGLLDWDGFRSLGQEAKGTADTKIVPDATAPPRLGPAWRYQ